MGVNDVPLLFLFEFHFLTDLIVTREDTSVNSLVISYAFFCWSLAA